MRSGNPPLSASEEARLRRLSAEVAAKTLTAAQREALLRITQDGPSAWHDGRRRAGGAVARMLRAMAGRGLVAGPPYEATSFGRRVAAALTRAA